MMRSCAMAPASFGLTASSAQSSFGFGAGRTPSTAFGCLGCVDPLRHGDAHAAGPARHRDAEIGQRGERGVRGRHGGRRGGGPRGRRVLRRGRGLREGAGRLDGLGRRGSSSLAGLSSSFFFSFFLSTTATSIDRFATSFGIAAMPPATATWTAKLTAMVAEVHQRMGQFAASTLMANLVIPSILARSMTCTTSPWVALRRR